MSKNKVPREEAAHKEAERTKKAKADEVTNAIKKSEALNIDDAPCLAQPTPPPKIDILTPRTATNKYASNIEKRIK
jgi:hypothetical protein